MLLAEVLDRLGWLMGIVRRGFGKRKPLNHCRFQEQLLAKHQERAMRIWNEGFLGIEQECIPPGPDAATTGRSPTINLSGRSAIVTTIEPDGGL